MKRYKFIILVALSLVLTVQSCSVRYGHVAIDCEVSFDALGASFDNCVLTQDPLGQLIAAQLVIEHGKRGYRLTSRSKFIVGNIKTTRNGDRLYLKLFGKNNDAVQQYDKVERSTAKYYSFDSYCDGILFMRNWLSTEYAERYCVNEVYKYETDPVKILGCLSRYATDPNYLTKVLSILKQKNNGK